MGCCSSGDDDDDSELENEPARERSSRLYQGDSFGVPQIVFSFVTDKYCRFGGGGKID